MTTTTPVVLLLFNRPDTTREVFKAIRAAQPRALLVVADGPRMDRPDDVQNCAEARAIIEGVDWKCDVYREFSDQNLGCQARVSSGITWALSIFEEAIILEDDCVPSASFFTFCEEMLERYREDTRLMMVSGNNRALGKVDIQHSYYFSRYPHIWGWATWRRAWRHFDVNMSRWPEVRRRRLFDQYFRSEDERFFWRTLLDRVYSGDIATSWDYQWAYSMWLQSGLSVAPARNLVRNIGFGNGATHTTRRTSYTSLYAEELPTPYTHPADVIASCDVDVADFKVRRSTVRGLPYPLSKFDPGLELLARRLAVRRSWI